MRRAWEEVRVLLATEGGEEGESEEEGEGVEGSSIATTATQPKAKSRTKSKSTPNSKRKSKSEQRVKTEALVADLARRLRAAHSSDDDEDAEPEEEEEEEEEEGAQRRLEVTQGFGAYEEWAVSLGSGAEQALWGAAERGEGELIRHALASGAAVDAQDGWGRTALHRAALCGTGEGVREL
eukprot:3897695-Rhodomonas_salina.1